MGSPLEQLLFYMCVEVNLPLDFNSCVQICISSCTSFGDTSVRVHESCHGTRIGVEDPLSARSGFWRTLFAVASLLLNTFEKNGITAAIDLEPFCNCAWCRDDA